MARKRYILGHMFYCTACGNRGIPIVRIQCRKAGHLKQLYCVHCYRVVNHAECIPNSTYDKETFFAEFESGNFDTNGRRKIPLKEWRKLRNRELENRQELKTDDRFEQDGTAEKFTEMIMEPI